MSKILTIWAFHRKLAAPQEEVRGLMDILGGH
jgi:hypothetical protein